MNNQNKNIFFALHLYRKPEGEEFWSSLQKGSDLLKAHGYITYFGVVFGDPYIQKARNELASQFLKSGCDTFFFVADDLEYSPEDMLRVVETPGDIVVGAYSQHCRPAHYPVKVFTNSEGRPVVRKDGCISAMFVQTGFMRIKRSVFEKIADGHPELEYYGMENGKKKDAAYDFFPQGVYNHSWIGEDYAFCKLWLELDGKIWVIPDMNLIHYEGKVGYPGNFHRYLTSLPGGCNYKKQKENEE